MRMTHSVDIRPRFVDLGMNQEASCVCWTFLHIGIRGPSKQALNESRQPYLIPSNDRPGAQVKTDHIARCHAAEMPAQRVHPNVIFILWISDADMSGHALCKSLARKVSEDGGGVDEDVPALLSVGFELRNS